MNGWQTITGSALPEAGVTTNQILIGVGLILALAAGSQVLASRLRIPAIIVLLPAGFVAGALTSDVNPQDLLGPAFEPLVSLSVAVILYDAGLSLDMRKLKGPHPQGGDPPHRARGADHLGARRLLGRAATRNVARRGGDARNHPRRLGADSRGPPAQFRPADRTAPAGPHLGGVTDRPGRRNSRRAGVPCRYREHPQRTGQPALAICGQHRRRLGR